MPICRYAMLQEILIDWIYPLHDAACPRLFASIFTESQLLKVNRPHPSSGAGLRYATPSTTLPIQFWLRTTSSATAPQRRPLHEKVV
jgi:hypothetical protein